MRYQRGYKTCKRCNTPYLHWVSVGGFWRLSNDPKGHDLHQCKKEEREVVVKKEKQKVIEEKFKIGQRIEIIYDKFGLSGRFGRIISVNNTDSWASDWYGVELDDISDMGHDCLKLCVFGKGYYVHKTSVKESNDSLYF